MGIEDIYWITPEFSVIVAGVVDLLVGAVDRKSVV